ncbi:MAG TPA: extracellular solute-binding protein [Streptosporangiaceae bacterium]|jgi:ABC-type glycerol-3-phosphate transport system substrate-binding protein|nr:extracellular solute-binding protein [Streptosporangiaceae bacterium]
MNVTRSAAAIGAVIMLAGAAAGCSSSNSSSPSDSAKAPAKLVVWRMGASVPSQVTWMSSVVKQFHKQYPAYKNTKVVVDWIPWGNRVTDWTNALTSGKGGPDITELGNTDTPGIAAQGALANITTDVSTWSPGKSIIAGNLANDTISGQNYAVPWFGGVRGIWYRKDEFAHAGIASAPTTWAQLLADAKLLMKKYPGTDGLGAPSDYTNAIVSFIWGAGGQVAVQKNGKWVAELNTPASEAGIKFYADLYLTEHVSPAKYIGETELGAPGATSGGSDQDFAEGKLDMYIDGPWAEASLEAVSKKYESDWASFPIPSENGPNPAPAFAGGSDLGVWAKSPNKAAAWDLVTVMDSPANATTFANSQGFFPEFTSALGNPTYASSPILSGFAKAAGYTQISPLNSKNWATADATDAIIPTMMKSLMQGASFSATVNKANTELQNVLNTGSES